MTRERVLITGGSGLVGQAIREEVETSYDKLDSGRFEFKFLSSKDGDLTDFHKAKRIFQDYKPHHVINLAARVGGLYANMSNNLTFYKQNSKINENVLELSREYKVKKCLSSLSTCIFPAQISEYPLDETMIHSGPPHHSNVGYSIAKRQVDLLNTLHNGLESGSIFTSFIPTNVYGRHDNFKSDQSHVIPGLIHKTYECINSPFGDKTLRVSGSGAALRQFIYAPDLAKLVLWCLKYYQDHTPIILCPDASDELTIRQVAEKIARIFSNKYNVDVKLQFQIEHADGQMRKTASNRKLRSINPEFEFTPIDKGLVEVIDWYCEMYPNIRM